MKEIFKMENNMVKEMKFGLMDLLIEENFITDINMGKVNLIGKYILWNKMNIGEVWKKIDFKILEYINGMTVEDMQETGYMVK